MEGGAPREIAQMGRPVYVRNMNFHPDGQRISLRLLLLPPEQACLGDDKFLPGAVTKENNSVTATLICRPSTLYEACDLCTSRATSLTDDEANHVGTRR